MSWIRKIPPRWWVMTAVGVACAAVVTSILINRDAHTGNPTTTGVPSPAPIVPERKLDLSSFPAAKPIQRPERCRKANLTGANGAWVVDFSEDSSQPDLLPSQAKGLDLLDFFWRHVGVDPNTKLDDIHLAILPEARGARSLDQVLTTAHQANPCGLRFVTFVDDLGQGDQISKMLMAKTLVDPVAREQHVRAVAAEMANQPLADGLTLDYEYTLPDTLADMALYRSTPQLVDLTRSELVGYITQAYSELIAELRQAMDHQGRLFRVVSRVRVSDTVEYGYLSPWLVDYGTIAKHVDQIVFMTYDFHWSGGDPGPIAPRAKVAEVWKYVRTHPVPTDKLALTVPAYGYDWVVDASGKNSDGTLAKSFDATFLAAQTRWRKAGKPVDDETQYQYVDETGRSHIVWDATAGLADKVAFIQNLCNCGVMAWSVGTADPLGSRAVLRAFGS